MPRKGEHSMKSSIFIFSGPYGVGKSTLSNILAQEMEKVALIEVDQLKLMLRGNKLPPWEMQKSIIWENMFLLIQNLIKNDINVIIDYVVLESELKRFYEMSSKSNVKIYYVVLRAEKDILIRRLKQRGDDYLIEGSLFLQDKLEKLMPNKNAFYDTTNKEPSEIINDIKSCFEQYRL
jgi:broad-specificity NMP kinase